jgi:hypothetical protein
VARRKAVRPTSPKARKPRARISSAKSRSRDATPDILAMQAVYSGTTCLGFLYSRGRLGVEAFDSDTRSLGIYPDQRAAADAVSKAAS